MIHIVKAFKNLTLVLVFCVALTLAGCEGTDSRDQVDDTVKELAGQKKLDQMERLKKDIDSAAQQQMERFKKTQESSEGN